jgi:hypothetical protein
MKRQETASGDISEQSMFIYYLYNPIREGYFQFINFATFASSLFLLIGLCM